jgi:hypothetical protein
MNAILPLPMSDNDFQNAQIQKALLDLNKEVGSINTSIQNLGDGLKENSRRVQAKAKEMQGSIDRLNGEVDNLNMKVKYWKFGLCFVLACGSILASIVSFGNETITLIKNIFIIKGGK